MKLINGMAVFGRHDEKTMAQLRDVRERAKHVALMADGHLGYIMPVGGVAVYENEVSVAGVGFDIACGNLAVRTDLNAWDLDGCYAELGDEIQSMLSFGVGRSNQSDDAPVDHPLFKDPAWGCVPVSMREKARAQLGTIGSGNHYVDLFTDEDARVWVGVHFGSRGFGHGVASGFMALAQGKAFTDRVKEVETLLDLDSVLGQDYWAMMQLAGQYAHVGREWVVRKVVDLFSSVVTDHVHNNHNFAWKETHYDQPCIVVRKGATPAFPDQRGFIGGSMGDNAVVVRGAPKDTSPEQGLSFYSTVHGAGRVMSRTQAAGKRNRKTGEVKTPGLVTPEMMDAWLLEKDVVLRGGGLDESPHAYRRLEQVLADQGDTIIIEHVLTPRLVVMAGANEFDPYKD